MRSRKSTLAWAICALLLFTSSGCAQRANQQLEPVVVQGTPVPNPLSAIKSTVPSDKPPTVLDRLDKVQGKIKALQDKVDSVDPH